MNRRLFLLAILFAAGLVPARDKPENWLQVRAPHFVIVTNGSERQGRRVADQFERMRGVFQKLFPHLQIDPDAPIMVLAVKDEKDFRALEPAEYLAKGQLKLGGLFLRSQDKNYVLMRLDAEGDNPYAVIYHEYTHLLLSKADWMPLWMNEGLAEFYQNTDIRDKDVALGQASPENLELLRENRLLPLPALFTVDHNSPYYHEENKGSIFYAESWALTYYLYQKNYQNNSQSLVDYAQLLAQNVDPVTAATRAFGDLKQLQSTLEGYVRQGNYTYFKMANANEVDDSTFQVKALPLTDADAVRADFLAYNGRTADARALIDHILQEDKDNVSAHETMGFLEFHQGHREEAKKWLAQAVKLDSQSYLAHYYYAAMSANGVVAPEDEAQVESSFRACIKLNPSFGPAYNGLAVFLAQRHRNLSEARMMALNAVQLDPANLSYRLNTASVLLEMERGKDAVTVIRNAMHLAKTPEEEASAQNFLQHAEDYAQMQEQHRQYDDQIRAEGRATGVVTTGTEGAIAPRSSLSEQVAPKGPHRFLVGVLRNVHCDNPALDLKVVAAGKTLDLHNGNYYKIEYSSLGVKISSDLNPCADLEGRPAKVEYIEAADKGSAAWVLGIEIHK
jgi:Flp pilus assembly protein TadD